ncbi:hypothetical protein EJ08DRAFT_658654 [Tothia fuscella]|uniref:SRR1-like domain-containing protein n=1 Tax=Tothia fuscella TaxID=1048955 RepID=A0A9P4NXC1_9PEZI|nr:hypothetical protein EJ08DRAFT_658654 [Tothia fuscella]
MVPQALTAQALRAEFDGMIKHYRTTVHHDNVRRLIKRIGLEKHGKISNPFAFALGSMRDPSRPDRVQWASLWQFVLFMSMVFQLPKIVFAIYVVDPAFDDVDVQFFQSFKNKDLGPAVTAVYIAHSGNKGNISAAISRINSKSFVFAPNAPVDLNLRILEKDPMVFFGNGMESMHQTARVLVEKNDQQDHIDGNHAERIVQATKAFTSKHDREHFPQFLNNAKPLHGLWFYWAVDDRD